MSNYLIGGFITSCLFNILWILIIAFNENIKTIKKIFISLFLIISFTFLFSFMIKEEIENWNNGICPSCGDNYVAFSYSHGHTKYECRNCHRQATK